MENERIMAILYIHNVNKRIDINIPSDITANELIIGLNQGYQLGMDTSDISKCFLQVENPIVLLKGNRTLEEFGLRNGSVINII